MAAVAKMEHVGTPIDTQILEQLCNNWDFIKTRLITSVDQDYGVYEDCTFKQDRFEHYLSVKNIPWPRTANGKPALDKDTFRQMVRAYPELAHLQELRQTLGEMRLTNLAVGGDGRNRTMLSAFRARTGRNQPSNTKFIFGPSAWLRGLIKPTEGYGLAYVDYSTQEVAIAAALSSDEALMEAYKSGDVYLSFAIQAGLAPPEATKQSHKSVRDQCKAVVLGIQYGMGPYTLAQRINQPEIYARRLIEKHKQTYPQFWAWQEAAVDKAMLTGVLETVFGWKIHIGAKNNPRALKNFPCQANGAEMIRLAACLATEAGLTICCPIHDALLLEAPLDCLEEDIIQLRNLMAEASRIVLSGFEVRTDVDIVRYPDRYMDERGKVMWSRVMDLLNDIDRRNYGDTSAVSTVHLRKNCGPDPNI